MGKFLTFLTIEKKRKVTKGSFLLNQVFNFCKYSHIQYPFNLWNIKIKGLKCIMNHLNQWKLQIQFFSFMNENIENESEWNRKKFGISSKAWVEERPQPLLPSLMRLRPLPPSHFFHSSLEYSSLETWDSSFGLFSKNGRFYFSFAKRH